MNFVNTLSRELGRFIRDPFQLVWLTLAFVFCHVFFITFFQEGLPQKLPIAVVDNDGTYFSRRLAQEINNTQGVEVVEVFQTHAEAVDAMQRQNIYAFLEIPEDTYKDVLSFKSPTICFYANYAYYMGGVLSYKSLITMTNLASGAVQREIFRKKGLKDDEIMGLIQPIEVDAHQIGNPLTNYQSYLLTTILPGLLGLFALTFTTYVIGIELKEKTSREWLNTANGNIVTAIFGKLIPYFVWFSILAIISNIVMFGFLKYPFDGSLITLFATSVLYVAAMMSLGVLFIGMFPVYRDALSAGIFFAILAFSLSGFTFPVNGMYAPFKSLSYLFPLRAYYMIYSNEAILAGGFAHSLPWIIILLCFNILPFITLMRLKKALVLQNYATK